MKRSEIIAEIAECDGLIVSNLGFPSRELYALNDSPMNFYMMGSMGLASSIGLGLALSQTGRVFVIDGDGSILMNMGSLVTVAHHAPVNFCLIVIDNKVYGSTGSQPTYTSKKADLLIIAKGAGNENVRRVTSISGLRDCLKKISGQSSVIIAEAEPGNEDVPVIPIEPVEIKRRFMEEIIKRKN
jgi:sulfopyruvate decarboxylase subunit beta